MGAAVDNTENCNCTENERKFVVASMYGGKHGRTPSSLRPKARTLHQDVSLL